MATFNVGEEPCTIQKIVEIMSKSASFSDLRPNWSRLARNLGVPEVDIDTWRHDLQLGHICLEDLMVNLVMNWKGRGGDDANLEVLCKALTDCYAKDVAVKLENEFAEIVKEHILATGEVSVHGKVLKICDIFNTTADLPPGISKIFREHNPIQILKDFQIPDRPKYYIQRTLSPRTQLNTNVFKSSTSDVFILENIDWSTLDDKLFGCHVELSSRQTVLVTAKFILLDIPKDYDRICQVVPSDTPVHLVRFEGGKYFWVRSRGSVSLIQNHLSLEQTPLSEEQFVEKYLSKFQNAPVCIADTPGMGKTLLLASIAQRVKQTHTERLVLFLVLRESFNPYLPVETMWKQITTSDFATEALKRLMQSGQLQFELFLDGYDEVLPSQTDYVNQLLLSLKQQTNIRIHVTTRLHMRNHLEQTLGELGYNIFPFTEDNQVDFLTRFWENCEESENAELDVYQLISFANRCLGMLKKNMNKQERDIAGIPLQCAMLAEVYAYDAVNYSTKESISRFEVTCKVESIFHMFHQLVRKKMERVEALGEVKKQQLFLAHVHEAIKLIFPSWVEKLPCIQNQPFWRRLVAKFQNINFFAPQSGYSDSFLANLYAVGLMEPSSKDAGGRPRFVHRTFAEFLIAEHLVKHLRCKPCSRLLVQAVLGQLKTDYEKIYELLKESVHKSFYFIQHDFLQVMSFQFRHNVIAYFVNAHAVGNNFTLASMKTCQNVYEILIACCLKNYPNIFKMLSKVKVVRFDTQAWTDMALLTARYSEPYLMELLVQLIQRMEGKHLSELEFPKRRWSFEITPLHVAVQRGSYTMTRYLVNQIYTCLEPLPYLLHSCVYRSTKNSDEIVKDKIQIIRLLIGRKREVVQEILPRCNATPLLLPSVHVDLMCTLIEHGADVNAVDSKGDTVLHLLFKFEEGFHSITPAGYTQLFNLFRASSFTLWDHKNNANETPLYVAVENIEVEDSVLDQYSHLNVDFNHIHKFRRMSVLFAAISESRTAAFIKKLEQLGADVNYLNTKGESALHIAAWHGNYDVARYLVAVRRFDVNHRDCNRETPLHAALLQRSTNYIKIQALLIDNGAELEDPERITKL